MRKLLIATILLSAITVSATTYMNIYAWADVCQGDRLYHPTEFEEGMHLVRKQGCGEVKFEHITEGYYLIYGVKVVRRQY